MKKAIRPGFGTDGLLLWRKVKLLRCGDGELCIAGEKDVICLVKINGLLKTLIQNVYPASVLHYDTGYGTVEAEEIRIGLFSRVCCQGNALAAKNRKKPPGGAAFCLQRNCGFLYYGTSRKASHGGAYQAEGFRSPT